MSNSTTGDETDVPCPTCGKSICLVDWQIDGCLEAGKRDTCDECGALFVVESVDYDITVTLAAVQP